MLLKLRNSNQNNTTYKDCYIKSNGNHKPKNYSRHTRKSQPGLTKMAEGVSGPTHPLPQTHQKRHLHVKQLAENINRKLAEELKPAKRARNS